jgi:cyclophilin family peptidyl-prolyl cis-trans isomerase
MPEVLVGYAEELGLDTDQFAQELKDHVHLAKVESDTQDAMQAGLSGTPSYIVNGVVYPTQELGLNPLRVAGFVQLLTMQQYSEIPPQVVDPEKEYVATIRTSRGDVVAELLPEQAPANVNGFVFLSQEGWYDGLDFFYVQPEVAAYSGDPTNLGWSLPFPGYYCGNEVTPDVTFDEAGMLALFTPEPGRNSSLFFITYTPQPSFNGQFTIIGRVIDGMDVAGALAPVQPGDGTTPDYIETILVDER